MGGKRITDAVYQVGGPDISSPFDSAVYLVDTGELVVIDSGIGAGFNTIILNITHLGFNPEDISQVILTHCHMDHIGGAPYFREEYGARILMHELDARFVMQGDERMTAAFCFGVVFTPFFPDLILKGDGGHIASGKRELVWLHTPGHTPGSLSLYMDEGGKRILFAQDIGAPLLKEFDCDPVAWKASVEMLLSLDADILCDGHTGAFMSKPMVRRYLMYFKELYRNE